MYSKFSAENVANSSISYCITNGEWYGCDFTSEQAIDLYKNGLEPDIKAGKINFGNCVETPNGSEPPTVWIEFEDQTGGDDTFIEFEAVITPECTNTIQWFKDNMGVDITGSIESPLVNEAVIESTEYFG